MPPAAQLTSFERDRTARLRSARSPDVRIPQARRRPGPTWARRGPSFGEEGFGDIESPRDLRAADAANDDMEEPEDTPSQPAAPSRPQAQIQAVQARAAAQKEAANDDVETPAEEGGLDAASQILRDQIDILVNAACYALPVLGHWLWWNIRMAYGSWIAKGNSQYIGPLSWGDVVMVILPGGKYMGAGTAGKAFARVIPDFVAHLALVFIDLLLLTGGLTLLTFQAMILYVLYQSITDPIGSLTQFGGLITSFL